MLKWTSRGSSTSGSGLTSGEVANRGASRAWPTYNDVSVAHVRSEYRWSRDWAPPPSNNYSDNDDVDDDDRDSSLSAYNDNTDTLEQMMTIDFNDDSQVCMRCR